MSDFELDIAHEQWRCICCRVVKPKLEFYPAPRNKSGIQTTCKDCRKAQITAYRRARQQRLLAAGIVEVSPTSNSNMGVKHTEPRAKRSAGWDARSPIMPQQATAHEHADQDPAPSFNSLFKFPIKE